MGSQPIPPYANVFMAKIDKLLKNAQGAEALLLFKRFLDDYFLIFNGSTKELHALFVKWNQAHETIKLTMSHTSIENEPLENKCDCEHTSAIPYLDVLCSFKEGQIKTDLYKKKTDRNTYLLPSSYHPKQIIKSIPFSLGLRIVRTCSDKKDIDHRLSELKDQLLARGYNRDMLDVAIAKARAIPRNKALKQSTKHYVHHMTQDSHQCPPLWQNIGELWVTKIVT